MGLGNVAEATTFTLAVDTSQVTFYLKRTGAGTVNVSISSGDYTTCTSAVPVNVLVPPDTDLTWWQRLMQRRSVS
jgi:hypothetical protein